MVVIQFKQIYSLNRPKVFTKINSTITENEVAYKSEIDKLPITLKSTFLPLAGGTLSGNLKVSNKLSFTDIANPNVELQSGTNKYYLQAYQNQIGIGPSWDKATKWDSNGNVTISKTLNVTETFQIGGKAITYDAATDTFII